VPVSPCSNTVGTATLPNVSKRARWRMCVRKACMASDCPTSGAVGSGAGIDPALAIDTLHGSSGQDTRWPPLMAEMAADGRHCTLSCGTAQVVLAASLQAFSDSVRRGMTFALALVARVRKRRSFSTMRCKTRCEPYVHCGLCVGIEETRRDMRSCSANGDGGLSQRPRPSLLC